MEVSLEFDDHDLGRDRQLRLRRLEIQVAALADAIASLTHAVQALGGEFDADARALALRAACHLEAAQLPVHESVFEWPGSDPAVAGK